jgi:hypothetical protein
MNRLLRSEKNLEGPTLEELLIQLRSDMINRCEVIANDTRAEALHVMNNNVKIMAHISEALELARDSTRVLDRAFGPSQSAQGGPPRIGKSEKAA